MKTLITTLTILSLASSVSFAQKGKLAKQILKSPAEVRASAALKDISAKFDPSLLTVVHNAQLERLSVRQQALERLEHNLNLSFSNSFAAIPTLNETNPFMRIGLARSSSPAKEILNAEIAFRKGYIPEMRNANKLLTRVAKMRHNGSLFSDEAAMQKLNKTINETVVNDSLRQYLLEDIANRDYASLIKDLADYYTLPHNYAAKPELGHLLGLNSADAFAASAISYLTRHPHKINLKWRRLMTHPAISKQTQQELQSFINKNSLSKMEHKELYLLLKEAYLQHAAALTAVRNAPEIQASVQVYKEYLQKLKDFIAQNGRLPMWNTTNREELALSQELGILTLRDEHIIEPIKSLTAEIRALIEQHQAAPMPFEEFLPKIKDFYNKHHRFPHAYPNDPNTSAEEAELSDQFIYWEIHGSREQRKALEKVTHSIFK